LSSGQFGISFRESGFCLHIQMRKLLGRGESLAGAVFKEVDQRQQLGDAQERARIMALSGSSSGATKPSGASAVSVYANHCLQSGFVTCFPFFARCSREIEKKNPGISLVTLPRLQRRKLRIWSRCFQETEKHNGLQQRSMDSGELG
jgi:hypothetical protein